MDAKPQEPLCNQATSPQLRGWHHSDVLQDMNVHLLGFWRSLGTIPPTLRGLTIVLWVLGTFTSIASVFPRWKDDGGRSVSIADLWVGGSSSIVLLSGIGMTIVPIMIYARWSWVRHALMLGIIGIALLGFVDTAYEGIPAGLVILVSATSIGLGVWYLYFRYEVVNYFTNPDRARITLSVPSIMGTLRQIAVLGVPIFLSVAVARIYWYFNIVKLLLVKRYGCGCRSGFNTNTITFILFYCIVGVICVASWRISLRLSVRWRIAYFGAIATYILVFSRLFLLHNLWL